MPGDDNITRDDLDAHCPLLHVPIKDGFDDLKKCVKDGFGDIYKKMWSFVILLITILLGIMANILVTTQMKVRAYDKASIESRATPAASAHTEHGEDRYANGRGTEPE